MQELALKLDAFEGPLDLLMHLLEREKIDIYDIPIVEITEQYISYLRGLSEFDMETASEFLVMAATLLQIKSRMLLPREEAGSDGEEPDPRRQLVEMLVEYRRIKRAAQALRALKEESDRCWQRPPMFAGLLERTLPHYSVQELLEAMASMLQADGRAEAFIEPQAFSVQERMTEILQRLQQRPEGFLLSELFRTEQAGERVASFLGVLELLKLGLIAVSQSCRFAPIYIFGRQGEKGNVP